MAKEQNDPENSGSAKSPTPQKPPRTWGQLAARAGLATTTAVGLLAGGIAAHLSRPSVQQEIAFHTKDTFDPNEKVPPLLEPKEYEELKDTKLVSKILTTEEGDSFTIWQSETFDPDKKTFVFCPGNCGHMGYSSMSAGGGKVLGSTPYAYVDTIKEAIDQGYNVLALNYVGYAGSNTDQPNQEKLYAGVDRAINYLVEDLNVKPKDTVIAGVSLGTTTSARAANHLASTAVFQALPPEEQIVNLLMMNGNLNAGEAAKLLLPPAVVYPLSFVWNIPLDTGKELNELAAKVGKGGNIGFVMGGQDPTTNGNQIELHRQAAKGMNVHVGIIPNTKHYLAPADVFEQINKMQKGEFEDAGMDPKDVRIMQLQSGKGSNGEGLSR